MHIIEFVIGIYKRKQACGTREVTHRSEAFNVLFTKEQLTENISSVYKFGCVPFKNVGLNCSILILLTYGQMSEKIF